MFYLANIFKAVPHAALSRTNTYLGRLLFIGHRVRRETAGSFTGLWQSVKERVGGSCELMNRGKSCCYSHLRLKFKYGDATL